MTAAFLIALQAATAAPAVPAPIDFNLAELAKRQEWEAVAGCGARDPGQILVCGRRPGNGDFPLEKWERVFAEKPLAAELGLGGGAKARPIPSRWISATATSASGSCSA
jgi:hypothetical protein